MIQLKRHGAGLDSFYEVWIDGALFCFTRNDNDGLALQIACAKLKARRELKA